MPIPITVPALLSKLWGTSVNNALSALSAGAQSEAEVVGIAHAEAEALFTEYAVDLADATIAANVASGPLTTTQLSATIAVGARRAAPIAAVLPDPARAFPPLAAFPPTTSFQSASSIGSGRTWPVLADNTGAAKWWGPTTVTTASGRVEPSAGTYGVTATSIYWEFITDAPVFELAGQFHAGSPIYVEVDGERISTLPLVPDNGFLYVAYPTRKLRRIRVCSGDGFCLASIRTGPADSVFSFPIEARPSVAHFGDSFSQGGPSTVGTLGLMYILHALLGWNVRGSADGGSGYQTSTPSQGVVNTIQNRVTDFDGVPLSAGIFMAGINDALLGLQAAVTASVQHFRDAHPGIPIFVFGPWSPSTTYQAANIAKWDAIEAGAAAVTGGNVHYIDTKGWTFGTGKEDATTGDGNADVITSPDGTHPTSRDGSPYLATRAAFAIASILSGTGA